MILRQVFLKLEPMAGSHISGVAAEMVAVAYRLNMEVTLEMNELTLTAKPDSEPQEIVDQYYSLWDERRRANDRS